jgi:hypothetical protein
VRSSYDYAVVRVVPRVEREEFLNAGVILFCRTRRFLAARIALDAARLAAFAPALPAADVAEIEAHLALFPRICAGEPDAGPIAALPLAGRFHWLTAPRSTIVQPSPVHVGLCDEPRAALDDLFARMVLPPTSG